MADAVPADWPMREASRFVQAGAQRWHVQRLGTPGRPVLLLVHGTGASTHTWRGLVPALAPHFDLVAPDLPGHALTPRADGEGMSLPGMARALRGLVEAMGIAPALLVGHSAGAAIAVRLALDGLPSVRAVVGLNSALLPLGGLAGRLFSPMARVMARSRVVPALFAWRASHPAVVQRLIDSTGSLLDADGLEMYRRLVADPAHAAGALAMMASWDLRALARDLPRLRVPLHLVVGSNDRTLAPEESRRAQAMVPGATFVALPGLGHLAHEERPQRVADELLGAARRAGLLPAAAAA